MESDVSWHGLAWGAGAAEQNRDARSSSSKPIVWWWTFADLHEARRLRINPAISPGAVQRFERKAWNRLNDYLMKLPPLPSDD